MQLSDIEKLTKDYADALNTLSARKTDFEEESDLVLKKHVRLLKYAGDTIEEKKAKLKAAIEANPQLFEKPKTVVLHGIQVGFRKGKGGLDWDNDEQVIKLIRKNLPEQFDILVKTEESPVKSALNQLETATLKKLGIIVKETGDEVVIKGATSDVEKWLAAFRKDRAQQLEEAA
jgi:hypothetical protein